MKSQRIIAYLAEPNAEKQALFRAVARRLGYGQSLASWPISIRGYPETAARAEECLGRAKKQPRGTLGRALKRAFLKGRYNWARRWFSARPGAVAMCWQGLTGTRRAFIEGARDAGAPTLFAELAPLPGRWTLDAQGVNAENSVPRRWEAYDAVAPNYELLAGLREAFEARQPRRRDVGQSDAPLPEDARFLFVPLQVPDDSQMILFAGWCGGLEGFIDALAEASAALPEGWHLRLKEHPSAKRSVRARIERHIAAGARLELDNARDSFAQLEASAGVLTVNSSMGLQAMFFDKPVIVTGEAFFAFEGVAHPAGSPQELAQLLADPDALGHDGDLRARFLTWLAHDYYIDFDGKALIDSAQLGRITKKIEGPQDS
ncbi:hypothetical protein [Roseibaca calidilacus]|uniref:Capsular polysaccharide export protein n=2 Tax=Roseibaca calidilacus TaxID=1666912 RepID=A0ABP2BYS0_9RHOB|nr:hypothetical protein [Roseibaca calidilacus]CUX82842.1 capsular polysaccharide export protein [Roseibaca calidilacus]